MKSLFALTAGALCVALVAPAEASPRQYSRGYYDCLDGRPDPDEQSRSYWQGCRAAERERGEGPYGDRAPGPGWGPPPDQGWGPPPDQGWGPDGGRQPRPGWGQYGGPPPGARPMPIPNVKGMAPGQVMAAMAGAGFRNVGTEIAGAAIYGFYFNPATRQCVQVANLNGRAVGAVPIGSNPRCR